MIQTINGRYDFAVSGGAVGQVISLGIIVPIKSGALFATIGVITSFASAGAPDMDFGYRPMGDAAAANPTYFTSSGALGFGLFSSAPPAYLNLPLDLFNRAWAYEITMRVNTAALTAGKFVISASYTPLLY